MTEVVSIKFKSSRKTYYFAPNGLHITAGEKVIVETAKGLEIAECAHGNRFVDDLAVVQPLRPVVRVATVQDLRVAEQNALREKDALVICQKKIEEHGLDMKLVDVECSFDGNKTLFFFTSDGRVDFRELVKDLAGIFHNRIELRQIGVRDEAKMLGGIGICGRPYCCNAFLNDFAPVSTKMAKVQNLSLNPAKISGSCGRLMCCLRYEEEAYEDLIKHVPRVGAFVETTEGYGTVLSVDLLRQKIKVHLENEAEDVTHLFRSSEVAAVPGGRPKEGEEYPHVLHYVQEETEEEEPPEDPWAIPTLFAEEHPDTAVPESEEAAAPGNEEAVHASRRHSPRRSKGKKPQQEAALPEETKQPPKETKDGNPPDQKAVEQTPEKESARTEKPSAGRSRRSRRRSGTPAAQKPPAAKPEQSASSPSKGPAEGSGQEPKKKPNRRRFYHRGKKPSGQNRTPSA